MTKWQALLAAVVVSSALFGAVVRPAAALDERQQALVNKAVIAAQPMSAASVAEARAAAAARAASDPSGGRSAATAASAAAAADGMTAAELAAAQAQAASAQASAAEADTTGRRGNTASAAASAAAMAPVLQGEERAACEALFCLMAKRRPHECDAPIRRYLSIQAHKPWKRLQMRKNFLKMCRTKGGGVNSDAVAEGNDGDAHPPPKDITDMCSAELVPYIDSALKAVSAAFSTLTAANNALAECRKIPIGDAHDCSAETANVLAASANAQAASNQVSYLRGLQSKAGC